MTTAKKTKTKAGRRERLLARKRPTFDYQFAVDDDTDAVAELNAAKEALDRAGFRDDDGAAQAVADAEARLAAARAAVEACYEPVTLTALLPADFEALVALPEHAPREGKDEKWNGETFPRACFMACVDTSGDMSAEDWAAFATENVSAGERESLRLAAISLNARWPTGAVPNV
jgi:hypothetical protein